VSKERPVISREKDSQSGKGWQLVDRDRNFERVKEGRWTHLWIVKAVVVTSVKSTGAVGWTPGV
jgi:hypothetical protein